MPNPVHDLGEMTYALKDDEEKAIENFLILSKHKSKNLKTVWYLWYTPFLVAYDNEIVQKQNKKSGIIMYPFENILITNGMTFSSTLEEKR